MIVSQISTLQRIFHISLECGGHFGLWIVVCNNEALLSKFLIFQLLCFAFERREHAHMLKQARFKFYFEHFFRTLTVNLFFFFLTNKKNLEKLNNLTCVYLFTSPFSGLQILTSRTLSKSQSTGLSLANTRKKLTNMGRSLHLKSFPMKPS